MLFAAQEWTALAKMVFRLKPLQRNNPPKNKIRLACYRAIQTKVSPFISAVLFLQYTSLFCDPVTVLLMLQASGSLFLTLLT